MRAPITNIERLSVINQSGAVVRYTYDVTVVNEYLGAITVKDVPEELAVKLHNGDELECNGLEGLT